MPPPWDQWAGLDWPSLKGYVLRFCRDRDVGWAVEIGWASRQSLAAFARRLLWWTEAEGTLDELAEPEPPPPASS